MAKDAQFIEFKNALKRLDKAGVLPKNTPSPKQKADDEVNKPPEKHTTRTKRLRKKAATARKIAVLSKKIGYKTVRALLKLDIDIYTVDELIKIPGSNKRPKVSIVIPTYNKPHLLLKAIIAVHKIKPSYEYEIVVVDNGNNHALEKLFLYSKNVSYYNPGENLGFVGGCNLGAKKAKAPVLVFLNDDTIVQQNWLDSLMGTLSLDRVGIAGSKLIYPDGRLQEAGGIIFNDASGNNYGKFADSLDFRYNYPCDVDYISGASIAIKRSLFMELGMFDDLYSPAYYEDTDLCFKVRKAGYKVIYQPLSVVIHYEGATAGTDTSSGYKKYQEINKVKFQKKWKKELAGHCSPADNLFKARSRNYKGRILFVENSLPEADKDSGSLREFKILKILSGLGYQVTFWPKDLVAKPGYVSELQQLGVEVVYSSSVLKFKTLMQKRQDVYDFVFLTRPSVAAEFLELVRQYQTKAKIIYDTIDLHFLRIGRRAKVEKSKKTELIANDWEIVEKYLIRQCDSTIVVSPEEKKILEKDGFKNIQLLSNIHDSLDLSNMRGRKNLLFIGNFEHPPNVDAVNWFCENIFPDIKAEIKDIEINIIGSGDLKKINKLRSIKGVNILGFIENVKPYFDRSMVFVAPLRFGAGVKGKIGQSIALGLPVVSTSIGVEGMGLENNKHCIVSDTEAGFAEAVIKLYRDEKLWSKLQKNSQKIIDKYYSEKVAKKNLQKILKG